MTAALTAADRDFRFLVAFRPGLLSPTLAAQMAATYQRHLAAGACCSTWWWAATTSSSAASATASPRTSATPAPPSSSPSCRRLWDGEPVDHARPAPVGRATPGWSAHPVRPRDLPRRVVERRARRGRRPRRRVPDLGRAAGAGGGEGGRGPPAAPRPLGRDVRFGIRLHVITRDTTDEAWADGAAPARRPRPRAGRRARRRSGPRSPRASAACRRCTAAAPTTWRSRPTCGPASASCGAAPAPRWSGSHAEVADRVGRVPRSRHRRVRALGLSASGGGLPGRRGPGARTGAPRAAGRRVPAGAGRHPPLAAL